MGIPYGQGNYGEGVYGFTPTLLAADLTASFSLEGNFENPVVRVGGETEFGLTLEGAMDKHRAFSGELAVEFGVDGRFCIVTRRLHGESDAEFVAEGNMSLTAALKGKVTLSVVLGSKDRIGPLWEKELDNSSGWGAVVPPDGIWVPTATNSPEWA